MVSYFLALVYAMITKTCHLLSIAQLIILHFSFSAHLSFQLQHFSVDVKIMHIF